MKRIYNSPLEATVTVDDAGHIWGINNLDKYHEMENFRGREAAIAYIRNIARKFNITARAMNDIKQSVSYLDTQKKINICCTRRRIIPYDQIADGIVPLGFNFFGIFLRYKMEAHRAYHESRSCISERAFSATTHPCIEKRISLNYKEY